ncbi:hypothetical protein RJ639_021032 [Escallonia herrerae]|uniref:Uncharacterized protein n=1 Tax=Escallonia herrerae TaxID=1293975 RepID=A0AA88V4P0_9ASTE|nr:hypothetical protein RJ639_021032 [Escallonia herrerae]
MVIFRCNENNATNQAQFNDMLGKLLFDIREQAVARGGGSSNKTRTIIIIAISTTSAMLIVVVIFLLLSLRKRKQNISVENASIGLLCIQENVASRPTMASAILMLNSFSITLPMPSEPVFFMHSSIDLEFPLCEYSSGANDSNQSTSINRLIFRIMRLQFLSYILDNA